VAGVRILEAEGGLSGHRVMNSPYMHWAKTFQAARYPLAVSGIKGLSLAELGATLDDVQLDGRAGYGIPELLAALAAKSGVDASRIVLATGTSGANHLVLATLLAEGDEVAMEHPVYEPIEMLARHLGATVRFFPRRVENGFRVDPADVAAAVTPRTKIVLISNLHNPSSVATDEATLKAVGAIADRVGAKVVVDEAYFDAMFGEGPRSAGRLGDSFVVTTSLTKVYGLGGLRCGWIVAEPALAERMWQLKNLFGVNEVHAGGSLALAALRKSDEILARARGMLEVNRAVWNAFLDGRRDLTVDRTPFGTTSFPRVVASDADALCDRLRERYQVSLVPGRFFGAPEHVRVGLCGDPENFREGLSRLARALNEGRENTH
jgi:aspartate/methionine/tyrosine aminotransferase